MKTHESIDQQLFEAKARWECECSRGTSRHIPCGKPTTHILEGQDEDGRQHMLLCKKHAAQVDKRLPMDWSAVTVTDIEDWKLVVAYGGRVAIRVGESYHWGEETTHDVAPIDAFPMFPVSSFAKRNRHRVE